MVAVVAVVVVLQGYVRGYAIMVAQRQATIGGYQKTSINTSSSNTGGSKLSQ